MDLIHATGLPRAELLAAGSFVNARVSAFYHTGVRRGEIRQIRVDKVDFARKRIELLGRTTKNKSPRFLPIHGDMGAELSMAGSRANLDAGPHLIQENGQRVLDWKKSWATACELAGGDRLCFTIYVEPL